MTTLRALIPRRALLWLYVTEAFSAIVLATYTILDHDWLITVFAILAAIQTLLAADNARQLPPEGDRP